MPSRPYARPPIQEALVELRFVDDGGWNWTWPGRFWELVKAEYDGKPSTEQAISVNAHQDARTLTTRAVAGVGRVFLTRADDPGLLALSPSVMSVHVPRPYPGWSTFRPRVVAAMEAHQKLQPSARVARVGVRYVNHIVVPGDPLDLADWFTSSPTLPEGGGPAMAALMSRVETVYEADASRDHAWRMEPLPTGPSCTQAREVQARVAALVAEVEYAERHLGAVVGDRDDQVVEGADLDVALRMRRGAVERRQGRLRLVLGRSRVVSQ